MKIVVSENSFKKILLELKEQTTNTISNLTSSPTQQLLQKIKIPTSNKKVKVDRCKQKAPLEITSAGKQTERKWYINNSLWVPEPTESNNSFNIGKYFQCGDSPKRIANVLKKSSSTLYDREAWAEVAFFKIKDSTRYNEVKKILGQDPYKYVQKFADVNKKYYTQPVSVTMKQIKTGAGVDTSTIKNATSEDLNKLWSQIQQKCGTLTAKNPAGKKHNTNGINIYKKWVNEKGEYDRPTDKLLYKSNLFSGWQAKVPPGFGWKYFNEVYPYPKPYSRECIELAKRYGNGYKNVKLSKAKKEVYKYKDEVQQFSGAYGKTVDSTEKAAAKGNLKKIQDFGADYWAQQMLKFNQAIAKQNEIIPEYCTKPLLRTQTVDKKTFVPTQKTTSHQISMFELCKGLGGLWVYGVGTAQLGCGCRDNSHPYLISKVKTDTGNIQASGLIQQQQTGRDWTHPDSYIIIADVLGIAASFVPVVGWVISAGISLGKAAYFWNKGDKARAGVEAMFAIIPNIGKFKIGDELLTKTKDAVINGGALTEKQLDTLNKLLDYDQITGTKMQDYLKKQALEQGKNPDAYKLTVLPTAVKETEKQFHTKVTGFNSKGGRKNLLSTGKLTAPKKA